MKNTKTHTVVYKKSLSKCKTVFKAFNDLQYRYGDYLDSRADIQEIKCNVPIDCELEGSFTTDFYCIKTDGSVMVRECVYLEKLLKSFHIKTLDASRNYWLKQGITDWGIVLNKKEVNI